MENDLNKEIDELKEQLKMLGKRLEKVTEQGKDTAEEAQSTLPTEVQQYLDRAEQALKEGWNTTSRQAKEVGDKVHSYAKENPWHLATVAGLVGFTLAALMSKKRQ